MRLHRLRSLYAAVATPSLLLLNIVDRGYGINDNPPPCPCDDESYCKTIGGPPVDPNGELYGFYGSWNPHNALPPGRDMNWTHITTVAWASIDEVMCLAHKHGARAILGAPPIDLVALAEDSTRRAWIEDALRRVRESFRDGIVFDYEGPQEAGSKGGRTYASLIAETRDLFHASNPSLQVSTCVPWSPDDIDGRAYPFADLAKASDLLYVMDYDTRSQIFDACIAGPNAPKPGMIRGIRRYLDLGIHRNKLVLGVPWYGYRYPCLPGTAPDAIYCPIKPVPFRGVNCSDAAGVEIAYASIMKILRSTDATETGGIRRDINTGDPFFNKIGEGGVVYQYWFDDPYSLREKYAWARENGLAGVGPFVYNDLDPVGEPSDAVAMWGALDAFFRPHTPDALVETLELGTKN